MYKTLTTLFTVAVLASISSCSTNPVTGASEFSLVSEAQEIAIGEQQYGPSQQTQGGAYIIDRSLQDYVSGVGQTLAALSDRPELPYEFVVLNNAIPNAWALPGGKIAINRGLLVKLDDEAELAAVLGHEIVHAAARHSAAQMTRSTLVGLTAQLATIAAASRGYGELGNMASQLGGAAVMAKYGRDDELESDRYGMGYMAKAGYDPQAAVRLQELFLELSEGRKSDTLSQLFASHPPSAQRVAANRDRARELPSGERYRERFARAISQLTHDAPAYKAQEEALAALKEEDAATALKLLDTAVAIQPAESQFWEMRGHAWKMLDKPENAQKAYTTAIRRNPELFSHSFYRGLVRYEQNELESARTDFLTSRALLPTAISAYYLGEIALAENDSDQAIAYFSQAMQGGGGKISSSAYNKLARLELNQQPDKYILSHAYIDKRGYLRVVLRNNTDFPVRSVRLQVAEVINRQVVGSAQLLRQRFDLAAGEQTEFGTGIGPLAQGDQPRQFTSRVTLAAPAD
ncbi:MAG: M48 family metalloprotease [Halioglobus sp.]